MTQWNTWVKRIETLTFSRALACFLGCESDDKFCDCISGCTCRSWTLSGVRNYYGLMATLSMQPSWKSNSGQYPKWSHHFSGYCTQISWWKRPLSKLKQWSVNHVVEWYCWTTQQEKGPAWETMQFMWFWEIRYKVWFLSAFWLIIAIGHWDSSQRVRVLCGACRVRQVII